MVITANKRAYFDYDILETLEAGIELKGFEAKAAKTGRMNLVGSYAIIRNGEVWLINADIPPYQPKNAPEDYDPKRTRRLLMKKPEIKSLIGRTQEKGLTLVPLKAYTKNRRIKLAIGLAKSRKKKDKRELIRKRETEARIREKLRESQ